MRKKISKRLAKAQSEFAQHVRNYLLSHGAIENDGCYRFSLPTPIGELLVHIDADSAILTSIFTRFNRPKAGSIFTHGGCNPYSGKWNFHFDSDVATLTGETAITSFTYAIDELLAFRPTAEFWEKVRGLETANCNRCRSAAKETLITRFGSERVCTPCADALRQKQSCPSKLRELAMRVIKYSRVSTVDQADCGVSLAAQDSKLDAYAALYDLEIVGSFQDAGESAKSLKRPGLQHAFEMLRCGEADGLLIPKLDRLTRNIGDWQKLIDEFFGEKAGKQLFSVADAIDTRSAAGRLVLNVLLCVAQWERETIAERTKDAMQHKRRNSQRVSRSVYGFDLLDDGKTLVPNDAEQAIISEIRLRRTHGKRSLRAIADELTSRGVPTKDGTPAWNHTIIRRILNRAS